MGTRRSVFCNDCEHEYEVSFGGGFTFELLRCEKCGRDGTIDRAAVTPGVETECECGGRMTLTGAPRCPICRSTSHRDDESSGFTLYD